MCIGVGVVWFPWLFDDVSTVVEKENHRHVLGCVEPCFQPSHTVHFSWDSHVFETSHTFTTSSFSNFKQHAAMHPHTTLREYERMCPYYDNTTYYISLTYISSYFYPFSFQRSFKAIHPINDIVVQRLARRLRGLGGTSALGNQGSDLEQNESFLVFFSWGFF